MRQEIEKTPQTGDAVIRQNEIRRLTWRSVNALNVLHTLHKQLMLKDHLICHPWEYITEEDKETAFTQFEISEDDYNRVIRKGVPLFEIDTDLKKTERKHLVQVLLKST